MTNARALVALIGLVLFLSGCAPEPLPFSYGRWESSGGEYFIEVTGEGEPAVSRLPLDPDDRRDFGCDSDMPGPTSAVTEWRLAKEPDTDRLILEEPRSGGGIEYSVVVKPNRLGDWRVLAIDACGGDYAPVLLYKAAP